MISSTKTSLDPTKPVWVYRNLHRKCYSIMQNGLVVGHSKTVRLRDCRFVVRPAGYKRYHASGCRSKNVHAFVVGRLMTRFAKNGDEPFIKARYNPREEPWFKMGIANGGVRIDHRRRVLLNDSGITVSYF